MAETTFTLDDQPVPFMPGQTILEAAKAAMAATQPWRQA